MNMTEELKLIGREYKNFNKRADDFLPTPHDWLKQKQVFDDVANESKKSLWRIHDKLYDFTNFKNHPGGYTFIEMSRNSDITELFESSHCNIEKATALLDKYYIADCPKGKDRNSSKFTFKKDGFYATLRSRVNKYLSTRKATSYFATSAFVLDLLLLGFLLSWLAIISPHEKSSNTLWALEALCGAFLALLGVCAHTFYHNRDSWRVHTFDLSLFSSYEWRISHVFSHHVFPNSAMDYEVWAFEPFFYFFPYDWKRSSQVVSVLKAALMLTVGFCIAPFLTAIKRLVLVLQGKCAFRWEYLLVLYFFLASCYLHILWSHGTVDWTEALTRIGHRFMGMQALSSNLFLQIGLTATHHHPNIWHSGDVRRMSEHETSDGTVDWGVYQLLAVGSRPVIDVSWIVSSASFGQHNLHHLFPTLDPAVLAELYPLLHEVTALYQIDHLLTGTDTGTDKKIPVSVPVSTRKKRQFTVWESWYGMVLQTLRYQKY